MTWIGVFSTLGLGGMLGVLLTSLLATWRDRTNRQVAFRTRQLEELYGPLLSLHKETRAHGELRVKLQGVVNELYAKGADLEPILKNLKDEVETFWKVVMPRYHDMVDVFPKQDVASRARDKRTLPKALRVRLRVGQDFE